MSLPNHQTPTATRMSLVARPSALVWRRKQHVVDGIVRPISTDAAGFERAEEPM